MAGAALNDKALSILTFAAYHALLSGDRVREISLDDGAGHRADPDGVTEMTEAGLIEVDGDRGRLTTTGETRLQELLAAIRGA